MYIPGYSQVKYNVIKEKYQINKIYLIKVKYKLLGAADLRLHLYAKLRFQYRILLFLGYRYLCHKGEIKNY